MVLVNFNDIIVIGPGSKGLFTINDAQKQIFLSLTNKIDTYLYSLIIYDIDAPYPLNTGKIGTSSPYVHLLIINIKNGNLSTGNTIYSYQSPNPPKDSLSHTYFVDVYRQSMGEITDLRLTKPEKRTNFDLSSFINKYNLKLVDQGSFKVGNIIPTSSITYNQSDGKDEFFVKDPPLSPREKKYCRCTLKVMSKQPAWCLRDRAWFHKRGGKTCYNPYAICAKSVGTTSRNCGDNFDYEKLDDKYLMGFANIKNIKISDPYDRQLLLNNIYQWKKSE